MPEKDCLDYVEFFTKKRNEFLFAVENFELSQKQVLMNIVEQNKNSLYGKKFNFASIKNIDDFQKKVPITKYDDYLEFIEQIKNGNKNVLVSEEVLLLEPTGGSSGGTKLIPYTNSLKQAFNFGLEAWLSDLFLNYPDIIKNPMYWSITPPVSNKQIKSKVRIGFDNDMDYLNFEFAKIISNLIIVPPVKNASVEEFYQITLNELKKHKNLGFVSVWNPTLFLNIISQLDNDDIKKTWNNLRVISCWADGNAQEYAKMLEKKIPFAKVQSKGLLATEGIITIPIENIGKVPCVASHFFEFIDVETQEIKLLDELEINKKYSILLTTQGGLYRYRIGDIVEVYDKYKNCSLLNFVQRENSTSDYFGEKLDEAFVLNLLSEKLSNVDVLFKLFAPKKEENKFYYALYLQTKTKIDIKLLEHEIEKELNKSFHYNYARKLAQIEKFKIILIEKGSEQYLNNCTRKGQKLGDIKPITFSNNTDWNFIEV